jgi:hypothetical protein
MYQTVENDHQDIVEWSAPSETKQDITNRIRAGNVGTMPTLGSTAHTDWRKMMVKT